ncbi:alkaline phosphatase synthesis sensor protein PhoR [Abditibacteriota bacterium]|nr:alkaline phosphatase synthesis sensor protein PhoR [Abditibacteriota bacterium]
MMKVFRTVHGKLSLVLFTLLLLVFVLCAALSLFTTRAYIREVDQHLNRALASDLAKHLIAKNLLRDDPSTQIPTRAEIKQSMVLNPDIEIYILDSRGRILDYSAAPGEVRLHQVSLGPLQRFIGGVGPLPIYGDDPRHPNQQKIFSASRIPPSTSFQSRKRVKGYIYIILGGQQYDAAAGAFNRSYILRWSLYSLAGVLAFVAVTGAVFFGFLTRRLRRLTHGMEEFGARHFDGTLTPTFDASNGDEIERLERMFRQMSERIVAQITKLQQADTYRREAISNVSHDLRTPLAALQGYLETLQMKENVLSPQERSEYLSTATRHSQRLGKMVTELFELARLESGTMEIHPERFSLAELVQDVTMQFELAAQKKGVRLKTNLDNERPFVSGDIGLIERALANLIDNALRYTPAGGDVTVALMPGTQHATVRVTDTGNGIGGEELPHIFERYYRVGREAAQESSGGAGLGLAITRRIIELHGGTIEADSALGKGATFTFSLPIASHS